MLNRWSLTQAICGEGDIPYMFTYPLIEEKKDNWYIPLLMNKIINMINQDSLSEENVQKLCLAIGQILSKHVFDDSKTCLSLYRDLDKLPDLDCKNFLKDRPKSLLTFLTSVSGVDFETCFQKRLNALCLLVEQLYYVRNMNFIGAFSFSQNIVRWSLAGSKTLQTIDGASTAAGSVTSLKKVLKNAASKPNACFKEGDVDVYFDNTQRIGKTGRVRENGITPMNIATNVVFIQNHSYSNIQSNEGLKPGHWLQRDKSTPEKIMNLEKEVAKEYMDPYTAKEQNALISQVEKELWFDEESEQYNDHITLSSVVALTQPEKCLSKLL